MTAKRTFVCPTCGRERPESQRVETARVRRAVVDRMRRDFPDWDGVTTCRADMHKYRIALLREALEAERGTISSLEGSVLDRMEQHQLVAKNVEATPPTFGARLADRVADFGGSWPFLGGFAVVLALWIGGNVALIGRPFDPYPFILLNLVLSCLAAVQAPVIMMSQNRHAAKDRERAEHDYEINLKAELELQLLHEKLDHLMFDEWQRLLEIQALQTDMLEELTSRTLRR